MLLAHGRGCVVRSFVYEKWLQLLLNDDNRKLEQDLMYLEAMFCFDHLYWNHTLSNACTLNMTKHTHKIFKAN